MVANVNLGNFVTYILTTKLKVNLIDGVHVGEGGGKVGKVSQHKLSNPINFYNFAFLFKYFPH